MTIAGKPETGLIGAVEAGGTKFVLALARPDGTIVARTRLPTQSPHDTFAAMGDFFDQGSATHGKIAAFGIASFGPIDVNPASPDYGTITTTTKRGWAGANYHEVLDRFDAPVQIHTDVVGAAIGEWLRGAGQGATTLAYTTVGTGIGSGIIREGRPLMGFTHYETGHILPPHDRAADPFAGICTFHRDCVEGLASGPAIKSRWGKSLDELADNPAAVPLIAGYLGHLAATLVLMHMPDRLIFGGGVLKTPGLIEAVRLSTRACLAGYVQHARLDADLVEYITAPALGDDAGIMGAIELGRQALRP
jgi:fructokinase